jgi:hypothetical protein
MLLCAAVLSACGDKAEQTITAPATGAFIKFFNFGVNAPGVNFFANDQKITAITSATGAESTTGTVYGGAASGGFYSSIPAGTYTLTGKIAATADNGLAVSSVNTSLTDGKYYSYYMSGFYDATGKKVDAFVIEDPFIAQQDFTAAYVRFVNASPNSQSMTLYAKNQTTGVETAIGTTVAYKSGGTFVALPQGVYDLNTRVSGSTANAITRTAVSFNAGRVYTISARGDMTVTSTTATNRPFLDNTTNR